MLIHFRALLFLCTLFCFLFGLHAFRMFFFRQLHGIHHPKYAPGLLAGRIQYLPYPFIRVTARINEKVTVSHRFQVLRRGRKAMDIRTGFHQHGDFAMILYDMPCKIITGEIGAYDLNLLFRRRRSS